MDQEKLVQQLVQQLVSQLAQFQVRMDLTSLTRILLYVFVVLVPYTNPRKIN
jgi:hypothetical protein